MTFDATQAFPGTGRSKTQGFLAPHSRCPDPTLKTITVTPRNPRWEWVPWVPKAKDLAPAFSSNPAAAWGATAEGGKQQMSSFYPSLSSGSASQRCPWVRSPMISLFPPFSPACPPQCILTSCRLGLLQRPHSCPVPLTTWHSPSPKTLASLTRRSCSCPFQLHVHWLPTVYRSSPPDSPEPSFPATYPSKPVMALASGTPSCFHWACPWLWSLRTPIPTVMHPSWWLEGPTPQPHSSLPVAQLSLWTPCPAQGLACTGYRKGSLYPQSLPEPGRAGCFLPGPSSSLPDMTTVPRDMALGIPINPGGYNYHRHSYHLVSTHQVLHYLILTRTRRR